jgi:hypothetical protein
MVVRKVKSNDILISFQGPSRHMKLLQLPVNRLIVHWQELFVIRCFFQHRDGGGEWCMEL